MKRRQLLKLSALALALPHTIAKAQMGTHHSNMTQGSGHHGMMMNHEPASMVQEYGMHHPGAAELMPVEKMSSKQPLQALASLKNQSAESAYFKATITAAPSLKTVADRKQTEFWLYNDQLPGPQIEVYEGDTVEITFKNNLPEASTIHWHGLPVPADQDGNPQDMVPAGQERTYKFTLPKNCAGTYWYHPHPHGQTAKQVSKGLAGTFIVKSKTDPLAHLAEQHWMISDLRLDTQANIPANDMMDWMNGREGHFVLNNGQREPQIEINTTTRLRIWNACAARYLKLAIPGCKWIVIGTDGGLLEAPLAAQEEILLAPAERVEVLVINEKNTNSTLLSRYYDRQKMMVEETPYTLTLAHLNIAKQDHSTLPESLRVIPDLGSPTATKKVVFSEMEMSHGDHDISMDMMHEMFMINDKVFDMKRIDLQSKVNEVELWEVFNNSHMDHPFHIHGTQFMVTARETNKVKTAEPYKAWRDTINLRPYETVYFKVVQTMTGVRMFHCHILEHEDLGMMANLEVVA